MNMEDVFIFSDRFRKWPLEIQTNGLLLLKYPELIETLRSYGFNTIAISADKWDYVEQLQPVLNKIDELGMISRITLNISDMLGDVDFKYIIRHCQILKIKQLTYRHITAPELNNKANEEMALWMANNNCFKKYSDMMNDAIKVIGKREPIRILSTGAGVYDVDGVAFTNSDYCVEEHNGEEIRSLIFQEDGHVYTTWNSPASILF